MNMSHPLGYSLAQFPLLSVGSFLLVVGQSYYVSRLSSSGNGMKEVASQDWATLAFLWSKI